jgi:type IV pilus assembly protein PilN
VYSLDINFLKDRPNYNKQPESKVKTKIDLGNLTPVYLGVGIGLVLPGLVFVVSLVLQDQNNKLAEQISKLEEEGKNLDIQVVNIKKLEQEAKKIQGETKALVTVFDQIRPWSAMLQDLRDRIPNSVQIETIKQLPAPAPAPAANPAPPGAPANNSAGILEINGYARSYADVNDFLLSLGQSKFLNSGDNRITTAELVDAPAQTMTTQPTKDKPNGKVKLPQVVKYTIKASLNNVPASDLIRELEQKGSVGLVTRLRSIHKTGVISK